MTDELSGGGAGVPGGSAAGDGFRLDGLLLLSHDGTGPLRLDGISLAFDQHGVEVSADGDQPRVLPWSSLSTHVVEPWTGEVAPAWWVDPELNQVEGAPPGAVDPSATNRAVPHTEAGALISLQTRYATYRFLVPGGNADALAPRIAALAVSHLGAAGATTATTVIARRPTPPSRPPDRWHRIQPFLVVALVVFLGVAVTLILLQSAGVIHLPFLGGASPSVVATVGTR